MERIHSINPDRIAWCCADFGISLDQLATEASVSLSSLERLFDTGEEHGLTFKQLSRIAAFFGRGVLFFLEKEPVEPEKVHTVAFRTLANQKPELSAKLKLFIERVEQQRTIYLALRDEMDDADLPKFEHPNINAANIAEAARATRLWLGLGGVNTFDTYRAAVERRGILVFRSNGYNGKWQISSESPILGFSLYDEQCPVIVVKKQRYDTQQSFTLMHELGHILLQRVSSIDDDQDMHSHQGDERAANAFAGQVLVPDEFLRYIHDNERPAEVSDYEDWLEPQRRAWGVSTEVILRRLMDTRRLPQSQYTAYREWKQGIPIATADRAARMYRHREPKHIFGEAFVRTVLGALSGRRISLAKASSYLDGLKLKDLHELERHYASL